MYAKKKDEHGITTGLLMKGAGRQLLLSKAAQLAETKMVALEIDNGEDVTIVTGDYV